jgi:putative glutamine amidotransferase
MAVGSPEHMPEGKIAAYEEALRAVGLEPVRICPGDRTPAIKGLLLTGGTDVAPALYKQTKEDRTDDPDIFRDTMEQSLLTDALASGLPVFAICRGMQFFNVFRGGTLQQHIEGHTHPGVKNAHTVEVLPATRLAAIVGAGPHSVNSRHHQAVARLGKGLVVSARSEDGIVEALELPGHRFALAVQWHPEDRIHAAGCDLRLFEAFAATLNS